MNSTSTPKKKPRRSPLPGTSSRRISRGTLHEQVAVRLRDMILVDELPPGEIIPEMQLCEELGISRTPMREALKVLASENLVELLPGRGAVVVEPDTNDVMGMLYAIGAIEGVSAELACKNITARELAEIRQLHEKMLIHHQTGERRKYFDINQRIHQKIISSSKNDFLIGLHENLNMRSRRLRYLSNSKPQWWDRAISEHEQILDALTRRDSSTLGRLLRDHMTDSWRDLEDTLQKASPLSETVK